MPVIDVLLGLGLLIFGRKLFWLFTGAVGFMAGSAMAANLFAGLPSWQVGVAGLVVGIATAVIAIYTQKFAIGLVGFLSGGIFLLRLMAMLGITAVSHSGWLIFIIGGILGTLFLFWVFDWALITLSSLAGASLTSSAFPFKRFNEVALFIILFALGMAIQTSIKQQETLPPENT
ncbi:MAG: hypothetical protein Kow0080_29270 [Candidatus Promineifilaceae bacterium]